MKQHIQTDKLFDENYLHFMGYILVHQKAFNKKFQEIQWNIEKVKNTVVAVVHKKILIWFVKV